jgi:hypothetical protein
MVALAACSGVWTLSRSTNTSPQSGPGRRPRQAIRNSTASSIDRSERPIPARTCRGGSISKRTQDITRQARADRLAYYGRLPARINGPRASGWTGGPLGASCRSLRVIPQIAGDKEGDTQQPDIGSSSVQSIGKAVRDRAKANKAGKEVGNSRPTPPRTGGPQQKN